MDVFFIVYNQLLKNIALFGINSAPTLKKNLIENLPTKKNLRTKIKSHGDEVTDFQDKKIPKVDSIQTFLAITTLEHALKKKMKTVIHKCF